MRSKAKLYQNEFLEFICMLYYLPINLQAYITPGVIFLKLFQEIGVS